MVEVKSKKFKWRYVVFGIGILFAGLYTFGGLQSWMYSRFPGTSSFAKYLPDGAIATRYEYESSGLQDYSIEFEASGTREDFDHFSERLLDSLPNARVEVQLNSWVDGVAQVNRDVIKIRADHEIGVELFWNNGIFVMHFSKT